MGGTCCLSTSGVYKILAPTYQTVTQCYKPEERIKKFYRHSNAKPYIYKLKYMMQIFGYLQFVRENSSLLECVVAKLRFITVIQKIKKG
jgi:hypothetical protein